MVDPSALNGSFQLLTSNVELLDPLVAFQVSRVGVKCPDAEKLLVTRALSEVNPLRFTGLNDLKFTTNIASLPISLDYFQEWLEYNIDRIRVHRNCDTLLDMFSPNMKNQIFH